MEYSADANRPSQALDSEEICSLVVALYIELHTAHKRAAYSNKDLIKGLNQKIQGLEDENSRLVDEIDSLKTSQLLDSRKDKDGE